MPDKILDAIHELKDNINTHFATKEDLALWRMDLYRESEERVDKHKAECRGNRVSKKAVAALVAAIVALSSGVTALAQLL